MKTQIKESNINRLIRIILKVICTFGMFFGVFFILYQITLGNILISMIGIPIILISYYLRNRIVRIKKIDNDFIFLASGRKEIKLNKGDILSTSKLIRFTFTDRFWMVISLDKSKLSVLNCYFFMNEPQDDFIDKFLSMGLEMKNIP
jgi:hypothetical protein